MERSCIHAESTEPALLYDWLKYIHEVNETRERIIHDGKEFWIPFLAIPTPVVKELFMITDLCNLPANTRYTALYLYDKFMCNNFWEIYSSGVNDNTGTWEQVCKRISSQGKLRLMSCIQIASKMESPSMSLGISQVISILGAIDDKPEYTPNTILTSEFKVFKTVGFKIPMGTPLDCVEILLAATGLEKTPQIYEIVIHLLDLSYLKHSLLYSNLHEMMKGRTAQTETEKKNRMAMEINSLFIGASVVLCTALLHCWSQMTIENLGVRLADLVRIEDSDIRAMADVLFAMSINMEKEEPVGAIGIDNEITETAANS